METSCLARQRGDGATELVRVKEQLKYLAEEMQIYVLKSRKRQCFREHNFKNSANWRAVRVSSSVFNEARNRRCVVRSYQDSIFAVH